MQETRNKPGPMSIVSLGLVQILTWGGSFFLLSILADSIVKDTGWSQQWVLGALSLGMLVSGLLSPWVGRLIARQHGVTLLALSGVVIGTGLVVLAMANNLPVFVAAWVIIGCGMSMGLYDALFATLGGIYGAQARSSIGTITLISGFCTTVTWPVIALLVSSFGWRVSCLVYAAVLAIAVYPMCKMALPANGHLQEKPHSKNTDQPHGIDSQVYFLLAAIFTLAAAIMTAISVQLITLLQGYHYSFAAAVALGTILGPSQVGVRVVEILFQKNHPIKTALISSLLVAVGLLIIALTPTLAAIGVAVYGAGNGLRAIIRGSLPLAITSPEHYPILMGRVARPALIGQALTPLFCGFLLQNFGPHSVMLALCAFALVNLSLVIALKRRLETCAAA